MKRVSSYKYMVLLTVIILIFIVAYYLSLPTYEFKYYYSSDKKRCVTELVFKENFFANKEAYFIAQRYSRKEFPREYVLMYPTRLDPAWRVYLSFKSDQIIFINLIGQGEVQDPQKKFLYIPYSYEDYMKIPNAPSIKKSVLSDSTGNSYDIESDH